MKAHSIILVEDNEIIRSGLEAIINSTPDMEVLRSFSSAEQVIEQVDELQANLFLLDIHLLGKLSGIDLLKRIRTHFKESIFIILTIFEDADYVFEALKYGAVGYLLKSTPPEMILNALYDAFNGGAPMSSSIARKVVTYFHEQSHISSLSSHQNDIQEGLTHREQEILGYLAKGFRYKEIAEVLFISRETVRTHIRNIYEKLEVKSNLEAVSKYYHSK